MLARVPIRDVQSLDEVMAFIESTDGEKVIIFDVDNTLAPQGVALDEFGEIVNAAIDRVEANPHIARVIALTNGPQREVARMVSRGNKPWTTRRRLGLRGSSAPLVVVGDQVLTDGLLAWRLGATFLHLVIDDEAEERRQAIMRRIGSIVLMILFRREGSSGPRRIA
jgi:predicted HAD superfamily phosphohydrolase YqeG